MTKPKRDAHASALGRVELLRRRSGALTYRQRGGNQTTVDAAGVSLDTYIHVLHGLLRQTPARRILMIGCGGGTLATMLARAGRKVTIVDIDPVAFKLARRHFGLPRNVVCRVADGLAFLQTTRARFDAVVLDAFIGEDIPTQFLGEHFSRAARRCLHRDGALFVNVCLGPRQRTADELALMLRRTGWKARLLDRRRTAERNAIVMAGAVRGLRAPKLEIVPAVEVARLRAEMAAMGFRRAKSGKR